MFIKYKNNKKLLTVLSGGTGSRKLIDGLAKVIPQREINVIVNTADDIEIYGLHISPDVDSVMYTLAGIFDEERGWGIKNDTFNFHEMITKIVPTYSWFHIGDRDLAIHVLRTNLLKSGMKLTEVTKFLCEKLNIDCKIIPMTNDKVTTYIFDGIKKRHFQEFWVLHRGNMPIKSVIFENIENASIPNEAIEAILKSKLIIIGPSNPITSINPILSLPKMRNIIISSEAKKIAVSPIVKGSPFSGPAAKLMESLGLEVSAYQVAKLYEDIIDVFIVDEKEDDERLKKLNIEIVKTNISLKTQEDRIRLAKFIIEHYYK
jgi:LPPG:FO 2-phospho-L-lactate transferase